MCGRWIISNPVTYTDSSQPGRFHVETYQIASNYGRSPINAWTCLVASRNSIITLGLLLVHNSNFIYMVLLSLFFPPSSSNMTDNRQQSPLKFV